MSMILINQSIDKNEIEEKPNSSASRELPHSVMADTTESNYRFNLNLWHVCHLKYKDKRWSEICKTQCYQLYIPK